MAQTPNKRHYRSPKTSTFPCLNTPPILTSVRRSSRLKSSSSPDSLITPIKPSSRRQLKYKTPQKGLNNLDETRVKPLSEKPPIASKKRKRDGEGKVYYKKVAYDGGEFAVGDDVYVKRREDVNSDDEIVDLEECRVCFKVGKSVMIECDDCLGGYHLKCVKPPLKEVPEGDWICGFCEARKNGKEIEMPSPPKGKKRTRTAREKLL